jgi:hypothetical protein
MEADFKYYDFEDEYSAHYYDDPKTETPELIFYYETIQAVLDRRWRQDALPNQPCSEDRRWARQSFSVGDFMEAVHRISSPREMRLFHQGQQEWFRRGGNTPAEAHHKSITNIGNALLEHMRQDRISYWTRLKWWWITGARLCNMHYA